MGKKTVTTQSRVERTTRALDLRGGNDELAINTKLPVPKRFLGTALEMSGWPKTSRKSMQRKRDAQKKVCSFASCKTNLQLLWTLESPWMLYFCSPCNSQFYRWSPHWWLYVIWNSQCNQAKTVLKPSTKKKRVFTQMNPWINHIHLLSTSREEATEICAGSDFRQLALA